MKKQLTRILSFIIVLTLLLPMIVPCVSAAGGTYYTDTNDTTLTGRAVNYLHEHNIMGAPIVTETPARSRTAVVLSNRFYPNRSITKMELIMAIWNMLGRPESPYFVHIFDSFSACEESEMRTYWKAIDWAVTNGIIEEPDDGMYHPDSTLTTEQVVTILHRFLNLCGYDTTPARRVRLLEPPTSEESAEALYWAVSCNMISRDADFLYDCSRGQVATFIYKIYEIYQKKYGLTVVQTRNLPSVLNDAKYMVALFELAGATVASKVDIFFDAPTWYDGDTFVESMAEAFSDAKALDICYLFLDSHGSNAGMALFNYDPEIWPSGALSPKMLRGEIDKYNGTFVVFIEACHSGTFIQKGIGNTNDAFDAESFAAELTKANQSKRNTSNLVDETGRIKVLCSSSQAKMSWSNVVRGYAIEAWLQGCGFKSPQYHDHSGRLYADTNRDNKLSMAELYDYAYAKVVQLTFPYEGNTYKQHMVCNPENDDTIIFEIRDWEFFD